MSLSADDPMVRLAVLLFGDAAEPAARDLDDPARLHARYPDAFASRHIAPDRSLSPTLALTVLGSALERVVEIDWKDTVDAVTSGLDEVLPRPAPPGRWRQLPAALEGAGYDDDDDDTYEMFPVVDAQVRREGMSTAWFQIDSDSYPFVVFPHAHAAALRELAAAAGIELVFPEDDADDDD